MDGRETLRVTDLKVSFSGLLALDGVNLAMHEGEMIGFIGPNGSGKSTLFNCITGMVRPSSGKVLVGDVEVGSAAPWRIARMGIGRTFQSGGVFESFSLYDHTRCALDESRSARSSRSETRPLVMDALSAVGLADHWASPVKELSYGQQKLAAIATAIVRRPSILLLDEPFSGVNEFIVESISNLLRELHGEWWSLVAIVEHDIVALTRLCSDRIVALDEGRVIADGSPADVMELDSVVESYIGASR